MHEDISHAEQQNIVRAFNLKPKQGIAMIKKRCQELGIAADTPTQIAEFFMINQKELDLEAVGDYLGSDENRKVLAEFTKQFDFDGKDFTAALRVYLKAFKLPGEAQKIDRLVEEFSKKYCADNADTEFANQDAAYVLAFQVIMLNTDLHNPNITADKKMSTADLKRNLRGCNDGNNFSERLLVRIYNDIKANPFELNFVKTAPGYVLMADTLGADETFQRLDRFFSTDDAKLSDVFPDLGAHIIASVDEPKSMLQWCMGYQGTITLSDRETNTPLVTIQYYTPNFLSRMIFGEKPTTIIQPVYQTNQAEQAVDLAAKVAASFTSPVESIKATYDYLVDDLESAYQKHLALSQGSTMKGDGAENQDSMDFKTK